MLLLLHQLLRETMASANVQHGSATLVQAAWRRRMAFLEHKYVCSGGKPLCRLSRWDSHTSARRRKEEEAAARKLQAMSRGHQVRKHLAAESEKQRQAAVMIQVGHTHTLIHTRSHAPLTGASRGAAGVLTAVICMCAQSLMRQHQAQEVVQLKRQEVKRAEMVKERQVRHTLACVLGHRT